MNLCQKVILTRSLKLSSALVPGETLEEGDLTKSYKLSFHPFSLKAASEISFSKDCAPVNFELNLLITDDEHRRPLFEALSQTRSLLLVSEIIHGLVEALEVFGFIFTGIEPQKSVLKIAFSAQESPRSALVGALMLLKTSIDSLLFVRGLKLGHAELDRPNVDSEMKNALEHIFFERADAQ